jgi:hypothetical protein
MTRSLKMVIAFCGSWRRFLRRKPNHRLDRPPPRSSSFSPPAFVVPTGLASQAVPLHFVDEGGLTASGLFGTHFPFCI